MITINNPLWLLPENAAAVYTPRDTKYKSPGPAQISMALSLRYLGRT
jgi:hypothetical protein